MKATNVMLGGCMVTCAAVVLLNTNFYLTVFLVSMDVGIGKQTAVTMVSGMNVANLVGVGVGILIATKVKDITMLTIGLLICLLGNLSLAAAVTSIMFDPIANPQATLDLSWASIILMGVVGSGNLSCSYSYLNRRIRMSSRVVGALAFTTTVVNIAAGLLLGQLVASYPLVFLTINFISISVCLLIICVWGAIDRWQGAGQIATSYH